MVAVKTPGLAETYKVLCSVLQKNAKLTVYVVNHIAAKHKIHSLPAFHNSEAVSDADKLATYGELARALTAHLKGEANALSKLQGQVANGQAAAPDARTAKPAEDNLPAVPPRPRTAAPIVQPRLDPAAEKEKAGRAALSFLYSNNFIGEAQRDCVLELMEGEEKEFFFDKMIELRGVVDAMPKTYATKDTPTEDKIAHLHYFTGACDWFIVEKDKGQLDGVPPQSQAWGFANLGDDENAETGYISLHEVTQNRGELDFNWKPKPLRECMPKTPSDRRHPTMADLADTVMVASSTATAPVVTPAAPAPASPAKAPSYREQIEDTLRDIESRGLKFSVQITILP